MLQLRNPIWSALLAVVLFVGCGTTKSRLATEQLLLSNAVDLSVAEIDFRPMAGKKVYFDTTYIRYIKGQGFVNADYIVSSLRQQMVGARCLLQDEKSQADYIVEARVGALGNDSHKLSFGIPASSALSTAASLFPSSPPIPTIPEISLARRNDQLGAAKIAVFAYHQQTREPVWQSGIAQARSTAKDTWILGAGPFQRGTIHNGTQFAGSEVKIPTLGKEEEVKEEANPMVEYENQHTFVQPPRKLGLQVIKTVDFEEVVPEEKMTKE